MGNHKGVMPVAGFRKFDPYAFLEKERQAAASGGLAPNLDENNERTLAGLATLAGVPPQNENLNDGLGTTVKSSNLLQFPDSKNQKSRWTPAKAAKVAKVDDKTPAI